MQTLKNKEIYFVLLIIIIASATRIFGLTGNGLWLDEITSVRFAKMPFIHMLQSMTHDNHPPVYYSLLHLWISLYQSDFYIRLLSALFGVGTCVIVYFIGKQYVNEEFGLLSGVLTALSRPQVWASQEARNFIFVCFFIMASIYFFNRILSGNRKALVWIGYILSTSLSIYTFYYAFFVIFAENIFFLIKTIQKKIRLKEWIMSQIIIVILFLPWIPTFLQQSKRVNVDVSYTAGGFSILNVVKDSLKILIANDHDYVISFLSKFNIDYKDAWYAIVFVIMLVLSTLYFRRSTKAKNIGIWLFPFLLLIPLLLINILHYTNNLYNHQRYFSIFVPLLSFMAAGAILFFRKKALICILIAPLLLIKGYCIAANPTRSFTSEWRDAVSFIESDLQPTDCVICIAGFTKACYNYYSKDNIDCYGIPEDLVRVDPEIKGTTNGILMESHLPMLRKLLSKHDRIWLVISHAKRGNKDKGVGLLVNWLKQNHFSFIKVRKFIGIETGLCSNSLS